MLDISDSILENDLYLIFSKANEVKHKDQEIVSQLVKFDYQIIIVTSNQPYTNLIKIYEENKIDLSNVSFIDLITHYALGKTPENKTPEKCIFISNPANLTDTGIAITEMINSNGGKKIAVVFDSITTMLIYMSSDQLSKFIHFLTNKFRLLGVKGFFFAVEGGIDPSLEVRFSTFMDVVIRD